MKKDIDIQMLRDVLLCAQKYFQFKRNSLTKPAEILSALVHQTLIKIEQGHPIGDVIFDYTEIHKLVWGEIANTDTASKKVRSHKTKVIELLGEGSELSEFLMEQGAETLLTFESDESKGGAGATTYMWLGLASNSDVSGNRASNTAVYRATQLNKPFFWVKPFTNTVLKGWSIWGFLLLPLTVLLGIPVLFISLTKTQSTIYIIVAGIVILVLWRIGLIVYELFAKGVAKAPDWMVRLSQQNALFATNREYSTDEKKRGHKIIELVTYEAVCPICGDSIIIENGGKEFGGRYVGKCTLAPSEHVFTFDHVTKVGKSLRE